MRGPGVGPAFRVDWVRGLPVLRAWVLEVSGFRHAFTTRHYPVRDHEVLHDLGFDPQRVVEAEQVHGGAVVLVDGTTGGRVSGADGLWTDRPGLVLRVRSADCLPVLVADPHTGRVAAVHAGWRGLSAGILRRAVQALCEAGSRPEDLRCAVGPSVGPCCYEVDEPVRRALRGWPWAFRPGRPGRWQLDLREVGRAQLLSAGVLPGHVGVCTACTACEPEWFYSYRREGRTGRLWALVSRT
ncbi:MAG: peptidoglycan editing factor PgeF [Armatimonadota bacterium]|nr:peptidoglycan editing factor PgeF [Armatimonadota bacterium]MDR7598719.1 peptidoglycan editing factor PgeF [Armatimonadota bacterium]MDR7608666.1 peptidoglycan editing factor PgeF [Armatimonadota bacterium]